jgi:hypothetical protein
MRSAQMRSNHIKKELEKIKRRLETAYDIANITEMENDIKNKEAILAKLDDQNQQFKKVGLN